MSKLTYLDLSFTEKNVFGRNIILKVKDIVDMYFIDDLARNDSGHNEFV